MEENEKNETKFKAIPVTGSSSYNKNEKSQKNKTGFGKTVILPFVSGVVGCSVVLGTCFGVPSIRSKLINNSSSNISTSNSSSTQSNGYVTQTSLSNYSDTAVYAANKILPSIVGIKVEYEVNSIFYRQASTATATGSGIIISDDGYILTNNHIVDTSSSSSSSNGYSSYYSVSESNKVTVTLYGDSTEYEATIVGTDSQTDLAVIKIDKTGLTPAELGDSDKVQVGEFAMAIGNPLGLDTSVTCGVISATNREITDSDNKTYTLIQTDAAINSGNSGGALVNADGKVIGLNTLKISSTGVEGMGFAIPINSTIDIYQQLIEYNKVKRPYIGISGVDLDEKTASANKLVQGIYVKSIDEFSAAEKAGIKIGDVIVGADGKEIKTMEELNNIKNSHQIGDSLTIKVNRNGKELDLTVTLQEQ